MRGRWSVGQPLRHFVTPPQWGVTPHPRRDEVPELAMAHTPLHGVCAIALYKTAKLFCKAAPRGIAHLESRFFA